MTHSQTTPLFRERMTALATHLGTSYDEPWADEWDAYEPYFGCGIGVTLDRGDNPDYYILTNEEADTAVESYIEENLRYFTPDFLENILQIEEEALASLLRKADADERLLQLVNDGPGMPKFVKEAVESCGGRGHFTSSFDGKETKVGDFYIYRMN